MELESTSYEDRPRILLLGNGINRVFESPSWNDVINMMSCKTYSAKETELIEKMPLPFQAVIASGDCVDEGVKVFAQKLMNNTICEEQKAIIKGFMNDNFDAILTTNYSYEIEYAICDSFVAGSKNKYSFRKTLHKGSSADEQFGIFKYNAIPYNESVIPVWHIHGEAARPQSIIIGHYYYGKLLSRLQYYVSDVIRRYADCRKNKKAFLPRSWLDLFLIGEVHIVGLGLDLSEMDLWWLISCKKNNSGKLGGTIIWHEPNLDNQNFFAKKVLADSYGVEIDTKIVSNYKDYYRELAEELKLRK